ncbi:MAG: hypothetical protein ACM679_02795 [Bacteroidales bacterium]|jgi:hypothetical protein
MKKIMFNDRYGLTQAVLEGRKTQTRRIVFKRHIDPLIQGITTESLIAARSRYKLGETIAIAQKYEDLIKNDEFYRLCGKNGMPLECIKYEKGCNNKMFVRADLMPHHIRITNIRVERLQDISDEDCLEEGIWTRSGRWYCYDIIKRGMEFYDPYPDPCEAYSVLIDRISGKGIWDSNPYVFVYDFELVK